MKTCGDFGGLRDDGKPCGRSAGWGRPEVKEGRCRPHVAAPAAAQPAEEASLSTFHARFVDEYMVDFNQADAYRRAGGSPKGARQNASALMKRPDIQAAIQARREQAREDSGIRQQRVIEEYAAIAFADIRNVIKWGKRGKPHLACSSDELDDVTAAAISEIKQTRDGVTVKFHSKTDALAKLGQHLGMFVERSFNFDVPWDSLPEEALERIRNGEDPLSVVVSMIGMIREQAS